MENPQDGQSTVLAMQGVEFPLDALQAALTCCAGEKDPRVQLQGVFVHVLDLEFRIAATDGKRVFVHTLPVKPAKEGEDAPPWLKAGIIISSDGLKERLAMLNKLKCETALVSYSAGAADIWLSDPGERVIFKLRPVDGTFPDYQRILGMLSFEAQRTGDLHSTSFPADQFSEVGVVAKLMGSPRVQMYSSAEGQPILITFPGSPGTVFLQMPRHRSDALGEGAARLLTGAVAGTVAALKAHRTRWAERLEGVETDAAKAEAEARIQSYDERIAAIIAAATPRPALPAPAEAEEDEDEGAAEEGGAELAADTPASYALQDAVVPESNVEVYRRGLSKTKRKKEFLNFCAGINAIIGRDTHEAGGLGQTLSQLADGIPVDDWFDGGVSEAEAATRCADWRTIGSVLPPDEVFPGEEHLPVKLLDSPARQARVRERDGQLPWTEDDVAPQIAAIDSIEPGSLSAEVEQARQTELLVDQAEQNPAPRKRRGRRPGRRAA